MKFIVVGDPHFNSTPPHSRRDDYATNMFKKLAYIYAVAEKYGVDFIMFEGDFSHKTTQTTQYTVRMLKALAESPCPQRCLVGNHDLYAASIGSLNKTFIGIMFASGYLERCNRPWRQGGIYFQGYDYSPRLLKIKTGKNIKNSRYAVGFAHAFLKQQQSEFKADDYLSLRAFKDAGYTHLFVGHDHVDYKPLNYEGMMVYRTGSLSRGTKLRYHRERTPSILLCDFSESPVIKRIGVPVEDADEVYSIYQIERESVSSVIKKFVDSLKNTEIERLSIYRILKEICDDPDVLEVCHNYLQAQGVLPDK